MNHHHEKTLIGWQEWVSLPDVKIPAIKAKVDTGAYTSSLHAENIRHVKKNGISYVQFDIHPIQKNKTIVIRSEAPLVDRRPVRSSSGEEERRSVIRTQLILGHRQWEIELNLTKRDYMGFRMLLGRNAMHGHIIIDPGQKFLHRSMTDKQAKTIYL